MADELGEGYTVIVEGLNGRTTVWDDPIDGYKNGAKQVIPCLESHKPLDLVVIMVGTNDLKKRFSVTALDIANGAGVLVHMVSQSATGHDGLSPAVLLVAPPLLKNLPANEETFEGGEERSSLFPEYFRIVAEQRHCHFLDAADVVTPSEIDGIHLDPGEHLKLGTVIAERTRSILGGDVIQDDRIIV
jgi:lysophospholipase L1-like esterase